MSKIPLAKSNPYLKEAANLESALKRHEHCQHPCKPAVALAERMEKNQFRMHLCESARD